MKMMQLILAVFSLALLYEVAKSVEVEDVLPIPAEGIKEGIKVFNDRVIYHVPKHFKKDGKQEIELLEITKVAIDELDYVITYFHEKNVCHVQHRDDDEPYSMQMKKMLRKVHHQLPHNGKVEKKQFRPGFCENLLLKDQALKKEVDALCNDAAVFCDTRIKHLDSEKEALAIAFEAKVDQRKRAMVREFLACDPGSTMHIMTCPHTKLKATCTFKTKSCSYRLQCPLDQASGYWNCAYSHEFAEVECCDYGCQR